MTEQQVRKTVDRFILAARCPAQDTLGSIGYEKRAVFTASSSWGGVHTVTGEDLLIVANELDRLRRLCENQKPALAAEEIQKMRDDAKKAALINFNDVMADTAFDVATLANECDRLRSIVASMTERIAKQ